MYTFETVGERHLPGCMTWGCSWEYWYSIRWTVYEKTLSDFSLEKSQCMYTCETVGERHLPGCMTCCWEWYSMLNCIWEDMFSLVRQCMYTCELERDTWLYVCCWEWYSMLNCMRRHYQTFSLEKSQTVYVYLWDSWRETPTRLYDLRLLLGVCMLFNCIWEDIIRLFSWERLKKTFTNKDHAPTICD